MNSAWKKLSLVGEIQYLEIVSAEILPFSKGLEEHSKKHIHYIEIDDYEIIKKNLNNHVYNNYLKYSFEEKIKEDWHLAWKDNFTPINIKGKITVVPDWHTDISHGMEVKIRPGMAFGTGHHETTYLMLERLVEKINIGTRVLDLGAGSGVLAIAAKKLGAKGVLVSTIIHMNKLNKYSFLK